ncbi:MAG: hypothetical protein VKI81_05610 [Synechococcaceae cyanobacterium]|nr:hypothetical protein [Synechococcaceae cyanobacterium]
MPRLLPLLAAGLVTGPFALLPAGPLRAQENPSAFPGRRVGGGSRGECTSRLVAHLVPARSVYAPGATPTLGVLEGPTARPRPLVVSFRPPRVGAAVSRPPAPARRTLPPAPAGITLFSIPPLQASTVWESAYQCEPEGRGGSANPLDFVSAVAPPATTLLVKDGIAPDPKVQAGLRELRRSCGSQVATAQVAATFDLGDLISAEWPARLPVRCL